MVLHCNWSKTLDPRNNPNTHLADKLNYSSGPIWLFSTREYRDYDSNRSGGVTIELSFGGTRADDYNMQFINCVILDSSMYRVTSHIGSRSSSTVIVR